MQKGGSYDPLFTVLTEAISRSSILLVLTVSRVGSKIWWRHLVIFCSPPSAFTTNMSNVLSIVLSPKTQRSHREEELLTVQKFVLIIFGSNSTEAFYFWIYIDHLLLLVECISTQGWTASPPGRNCTRNHQRWPRRGRTGNRPHKQQRKEGEGRLTVSDCPDDGLFSSPQRRCLTRYSFHSLSETTEWIAATRDIRLRVKIEGQGHDNVLEEIPEAEENETVLLVLLLSVQNHLPENQPWFLLITIRTAIIP